MLFSGLILFSIQIMAQETYVIKVIDETTAQPIDGLEVWSNDSMITKTNFLGYCSATGKPEELWILKHPSYYSRELVLPTAAKFQVNMDFKGDSLLFSKGMKGFYTQIGKTMRFPSAARNANFQGTCIARLSINEGGATLLEEVIGPGCSVVKGAIKDVFKKLVGSWDVAHTGEQIMMPFVFTIIGNDPPPPMTQPRDPAFRHFSTIKLSAQSIR